LIVPLIQGKSESTRADCRNIPWLLKNSLPRKSPK
jgi:hypothetical protein